MKEIHVQCTCMEEASRKEEEERERYTCTCVHDIMY